jgi:hypothetical protein
VEDNKQKVLLIKELIEQGYKDKHICMISQANQPYVSKIRNGKIHVHTVVDSNETFAFTEKQSQKVAAVDKILALPELYTSENMNQDIAYMHVLKFFMVDQEDVYNLYFHLSKRQFRNYWRMKDVDILSFDSTMIGVPHDVYLDLIIDYFI